MKTSSDIFLNQKHHNKLLTIQRKLIFFFHVKKYLYLGYITFLVSIEFRDNQILGTYFFHHVKTDNTLSLSYTTSLALIER